MSKAILLSVLVPFVPVAGASAVTTQRQSDVFDGRSFLYVEAESFSQRDRGDGPGPGVDPPDGYGGFVEVGIQELVSTQGVDILPTTSNVFGTAIIDAPGGGQHAHTVTYEVEFVTPGTYQFYTRHTMFDFDGNGNFGNEDSIFVSPAFNLNSSTDWVDFEGLEWNDSVDLPAPGSPLDMAAFQPSTGDSPNDGWFAIRDWGVKSGGVVEFNNDASSDFWNGNFHWYNRPFYVATGPGGGFSSDFGFKTEFIVTEEQLHRTLTFEIGTREVYGAFDAFLFIQDDELDLLDLYTQSEITIEPHCDFCPDFDKDGDVDGDDFLIWQANFGTANGATFNDGDADGDGDVDGDDFLTWQVNFGMAFGAAANDGDADSDGGDLPWQTAFWIPGHLAGRNAAAVPEPGLLMLALALFAVVAPRYRNRAAQPRPATTLHGRSVQPASIAASEL